MPFRNQVSAELWWCIERLAFFSAAVQRIATFHLHHPSNNPLQLVPFCSETKVTSTSEVIALYWDEELIMDADVPSFIEQFPK